MSSPYIPINLAINQIKDGIPVIILDNPERENEGDFFVAATEIEPKHISFMFKYARGNICVPLTYERASYLQLTLQHPNVEQDKSFCRTLCEVDFINVHGGVSYRNRVDTIRALADPLYSYKSFNQGHTRPLRADRGGLLTRLGHTEGAVELSRLAGLQPAGVICELVGDNGYMLKGKDLEGFALKHNIGIITINDIVNSIN